MANELTKTERGQLAVQEPSIGQMLHKLLSEGRPASELKELMDLYERMQTKSAEQQFNIALSAFQTEAKTITKNRQVDFVSQKGGRVSYGFTDWESLLDQLRPMLDKHGFAFSHDTKVDERQMMTVTCTLRHVAGHRETSSFTCPTTAQTPLMSDQQRYAASLTFARRYTLIQILGLATGDPDPDDAGDPTTITPDQQRQIQDALIEVASVWKTTKDQEVQALLSKLGLSAIGEIRTADFNKVWNMIEAKRRKARA